MRIIIFSVLITVVVISCGVNNSNAQNEIPVENTYGDYYPLHVGNQWTYNYNSYFRHNSSGDGTYKEGTLNYLLLNVDSSNQFIQYSLVENFTGTIKERYLWSGDPIIDTTYTITDSLTYFTIYEDSSNKIFSDNNNCPYYLRGVLLHNGLSRYYPLYVGDTLSVGDEYIGYKLVKDIGLYYYVYGTYSMHTGKTELELINFVNGG